MASYFPKSQIKPNLITDGNEYMILSTGTPYSGFYYKISTGQKYTGKTPQDGGNFELVPITNANDGTPSIKGNEIVFTDNWDGNESYISKNGPIINDQYIKVTIGSDLPPPRFLPSYNSPKPTKKDYKIGEFQRYFCKKTNELIYLEIDKETFQQLTDEDPKIAFDLYNPIKTSWSLTGSPQSVFNTNKKIIALIERNQKWYGFTKYFQDKFSEYYLEK